MFVNVSPINQSLVRLVADGVCELPTSKKSLTLAGCPGFQQLLELRNEKHKADWLLTSTAGSSEGARKLFSAKPSKASPKKMQKRSAGALRELRQSPTVMLIRVPGVNGSPSLEVEVARPVHPCDVLAVRLEPTAIEHVLLFLRSSVTTDALKSAREYAQSGQKGVWQRKNSACLVKRPDPRIVDEPNWPKQCKLPSLCWMSPHRTRNPRKRLRQRRARSRRLASRMTVLKSFLKLPT